MDQAPWNICIDIEGFSALWGKPGDDDRVLWALCELLRAVYRIGTWVYPKEPDRLFAIQAGDGVFLHSSFHEEKLDRAVAIAVVMMRHVAAHGRLAKVAIAEGEVGDINGCYPREVTDAQHKDGTVHIGAGRLITFPYMGPGIINSAVVAKRSPPGPLLILPSAMRDRIPEDWPIKECSEDHRLSAIDWVHLESDLVDRVQRDGDLKGMNWQALENMLRGYCGIHAELPARWRENVREFLNVEI
ncbi:MAG: hypothetical protein AB7I36_09835 [Rhodospirillaceae bacterium]